MARKNKLVPIVLILVALGFVAYYSNMFAIEVLDDYVVYDNFNDGAIDLSLWTYKISQFNTPEGIREVIDSKVWVSQISSVTYDSPIETSLLNMRTGTNMEIQMMMKKDIKGMNFKADIVADGTVDAKITNCNYDWKIFGESILFRVPDSGTWLISQWGSANPGEHNSGTIELVSSKLDKNMMNLYWKGTYVNTLNLSKIPEACIVFTVSGEDRIGGSSNLNLDNVRYQVPFSCEIPENHFLAVESFSGGKEINIESTRFEVKSFCLANPAIITSESQGGSTSDVEIYQRMVRGETLTIPTDQTWTLFYVFKNPGTIPTVCEKGQAFSVSENKCTTPLGIVQVCSEGMFDPTSGLCTIQAESTIVCPEGGRYDTEQKKCIIEAEVITDCPAGTYDATKNKCIYTPEAECVGTTCTLTPQQTQEFKAEEQVEMKSDTNKLFKLAMIVIVVLAVLGGLYYVYKKARR